MLIDNKPWDASITYEQDHKHSKFLTKEDSLILKVGPQDSYWRFKFENTRRKNIIDHYQSLHFLKHETMPTFK
jgi:hypothetical protein